MNAPNYHGGSIVNLMSSIESSLGGKPVYENLDMIKSIDLNKSKNVILFIIDGLGYEYLTKKAKGTYLNNNLIGKITSVFPPTTVSASTSFSTGFAPQQHALTGWFIYLKEIGVLSQIMTFNPRIGGNRFSKQGIQLKSFVDTSMVSERVNVDSFSIISNEYLNSDFTNATKGESKIIGFSSLNSFFSNIGKVIKKKTRKRKFIYAYWTEFDSMSHKSGTNSVKLKEHLKKIDIKLKKLVKRLKGTNTQIIVTADHGLIDVPKNSSIKLEDHPKLKECLLMPFCGEPRVIYCYVKASKTKFFENYVKKELKKYCRLYKSYDLIKKGFFGNFTPSKNTLDRIGNYILIMKGNYIFEDRLLNEKYCKFKAHHGGMSKEELYVPIILINSE